MSGGRVTDGRRWTYPCDAQQLHLAIGQQKRVADLSFPLEVLQIRLVNDMLLVVGGGLGLVRGHGGAGKREKTDGLGGVV